MNNISSFLVPALQALAEKQGLSCEREDVESLLVVEHPPKLALGDLAVPMFPFAKILRMPPPRIADELRALLQLPAAFSRVEPAGGYVNFFFDRSVYAKEVLERIDLQSNGYGRCEEEKHATVVVEFSSPNSNKPLHLGHLRNNILGESVSRTLAMTGATVIKVNLVNDRGVHICKSMLAYRKFGEGRTPQSEKQKGDHFVGDYYVRFLKWAEEDEGAESEAQELLQAWESGDEEARKLWSLLREWTLEGHRQTYARTGISFDAVDYESETYLLGKDIVREGEKRGVFFRGEENEIAVDLSEIGLDQKVLLRSDGTALYVTQDLGTAQLRSERWNFDRMIYVVGSEQNYHFTVLFEVLKRLGHEWASQLSHLSYGMVNLPDGRLKSREGRTVDADLLLDSLAELAQREIRKRAHIEKDVEDIAESIAIAALHYYLLRPQPGTDITFDPDASLEFQGHTGPYIQYMVARIYSLEERLEVSLEKLSVEELYDDDAWALVRQLGEFPDIVLQAARTLNPALVAEYVYRLAKNFSQYYHVYPIIDRNEETRSASRLILSRSVRQVLENGMYLLGIPILRSM